MVRWFAIGLFAGFPAGCYLREQGYHHRLQQAYRVIRPKDDGKLIPSCIYFGRLFYSTSNEQIQGHKQIILQRSQRRQSVRERLRETRLWLIRWKGLLEGLVR